MTFSGLPFSSVPFSSLAVGGPVTPNPFVTLLDSAAAQRCFLADIDAYDVGGAALATLRMGSQGYTSQPTDTPASTYWHSHLAQPIDFARRIDHRDGLGGIARIDGETEIINIDGTWDSLLDNYAIDGRRILVRMGRPGDPLTNFGHVLVAFGLDVEGSRDSVRVRIDDGLARLDKPVQVAAYAGTGALEGGADLKGKYRPLAFGQVLNVPAVLVDSVKLIYQVHAGAVDDIPAVYDRGVALVRGTDYASQSDLTTTAPTAGQYRVWPDGGYYRLGGTPAGTVTADVQGDAAGGYVETTADVVQRILMAQAGFTTADINFAAFAQTNADAPAAVGIWIGTDAVRTIDIVDALARGIGAFAGFTRYGVFALGVVTAPSGGGAADFTDENIVTIERLLLPAALAPVVWRVSVGYQRNYTVQADLAASVSVARRAFAAEEYRLATAEDATVKTAHLLARELVRVDGYFATQVDAEDEADRLLALFKERRGLYRLVTKMQALRLELGDVVSIDTSRFGFAGGRLARVVGYRLDTARAEIELTLYA
ncbi:MAG: hypothetical protein AB7P99_14240 [Vicinamibacterales bacterium]